MYTNTDLSTGTISVIAPPNPLKKIKVWKDRGVGSVKERNPIAQILMIAIARSLRMYAIARSLR